MRTALLATGIFAALVVLGSAFVLDEGEVVTLTTTNETGVRYETSVWVVERDGALWLRSGRPDAQWLARLRARPEVTVMRQRERAAYHAVPLDDTAARRAVNEAMATKYGAVDRILARFVPLDRAVPIRLDPSSGPPAASSAHP
jgi:hypothetical protein